ncbi:cell wall / vacuolar inhibitor of fructosidase 1-like [Tripterygium wilfordii]|uniref:Cell wall / vacuolar inhibitor of fructosidase 1-like n=1 Tax=Tripterygium wilfordii TaxID=458696 RepID=A0A7J7BYZ3_TRIWF|nr:cell wall / vacuolar inhibitor of fructosidase 1-like [Tripterygium wilfordii]KAF5727081.1 cell wall / vacuolar inhibitor of fructosidase 1-like [Tripterygium wilfordii]
MKKTTLTVMSVLFTSLILFTFPAHSSSSIPSIIDSGNIVEQTCRQTPYYDLCVSTLRSNPRSHNANIEELAQIMVDELDSTATNTLRHIRQLLQSGMDQSTQEALRSCAERYRVIVRGDVPEAIEAISKGDYKYAEQGTFDAATEARSCERGFSRGRSPLSNQNRQVHDTSLVAAAIVKAMARGG